MVGWDCYLLQDRFSDLPLLKILLLFGFPLLNSFCSSKDRAFMSAQGLPQQLACSSLQSSHCKNKRLQATLPQLVCVSQGFPH